VTCVLRPIATTRVSNGRTCAMQQSGTYSALWYTARWKVGQTRSTLWSRPSLPSTPSAAQRRHPGAADRDFRAVIPSGLWRLDRFPAR